jgi:hypothetical protein
MQAERARAIRILKAAGLTALAAELADVDARRSAGG